MKARPYPSPGPRRLVAALALAAAATLPARAEAQDAAGGDPGRPLGPWRVAAQVGSGVVLTPVGFVGGGLATRWTARHLGANETQASNAAYAGAWTTAALTTAAGPSLVGARGPGSGSYSAALAGALVGGVASFALVRINKRLAGRADESRPCRLVCALSGVAVFVLPGVGATVGYDLSR